MIVKSGKVIVMERGIDITGFTFEGVDVHASCKVEALDWAKDQLEQIIAAEMAR